MIYAIFDTETTGLAAISNAPLERQPRVIEFAGVHLDTITGEITREFTRLYNVPVTLSPKITKLTGLRNGDLEGHPTFHHEDIFDFFRGSDRALAHNFTFDYDMLDFEFQRANRNIKDIPVLQLPICTVEKTEYLTGQRLTLSKLHAYLFGTEFKGAHRALTDVQALARIVQELIKRGVLP